MRLATFLRVSSTAIVDEWATFALRCTPEASVEDRRDHLAGMLAAIARDLETADGQPAPAQAATAAEGGSASGPGDTAADAHGAERAATGYTSLQMMAEFGALRASVLRLWLADERSTRDADDIGDVMRFNAALDRVILESIERYQDGVARSKDLFLGILGHDLQNPLGAILMATSHILRESPADWPHRRIASRILTSGARMDGIIRDLVDLTRTRLGSGIPIVRTPTSLGDLCRNTVAEMESFHPDCSVALQTSGDLHGQWDGGRIGQVLSNLVGNAQQHGTLGAPVSVAAHGDEESVVIRVHNDGAPIPGGELQAIFDPFRRLPARRGRATNLRSMGLGLYIAKQIVEAHRGTIDVESGADGTTFTVELPRHAA
jgi:signal transduction histidine kinase